MLNLFARHAVGDDFGIGQLPCGLGFDVAAFRHHVLAEFLHPVPFRIAEHQRALCFGHFHTGQRDQRHPGFYLVAQTDMAPHDLRGNARRDLRAGVGIELHFAGRSDFIHRFATRTLAVGGEYFSV